MVCVQYSVFAIIRYYSYSVYSKIDQNVLERIVFFLARTRFYLKKLKIFGNYTVVSSVIKLEACLN